jgi:hypothetical protein
MEMIRAFIAGIALPSVIVPIAMIIAYTFRKKEILQIPFLHVIPLLWGLWNVLYFVYLKDFLPFGVGFRLLVTGALLGFLIPLYAIYVLKLPNKIGLPEKYRLFPLIGGPILYALAWLYLVGPINHLLGLVD